MSTWRNPAVAIGAAAVLAWSSTALGQGSSATPHAEQVAQYVTERLKEELALTAEQVPKVQQVNVATATSMGKLIRKYEGDTSAAGDAALVRGVLESLRANQLALKKVLTKDQWTLHQQNKGERLALNQTEFMAGDLNLSKNQILDVQRINLTSANKLVRAFDDPPGTPKRSRQQLAEAAKPIIAERDSALEKVLTAEQWKAMQQNRRALRNLMTEQASTSLASGPSKPKP